MRQTADYTDTTRWAVVFKALSDPTRLKAALLISEDGASVQEVAGALDTTNQNASSHLRQLRAAGVAHCRRDGKQVYYRLLPQALPIIIQVQGFTVGVAN
ncbi:ArsR/SmtB family transcription factor [Alicyclobacillus dauci]|uniref:Metalloregulator ArsR/SmtB family transcription factor n=1 Tax=Alicyclobacillus dauci TaxID=1475485 RepID=A0ABY6Z5H3_9BACL|nr:metalloregulator ArsR/SmtB family transcription factor [Alicyclobacillus dauci]WAH38116.1 metalloregulator ArsR/SmtB family transcription factor [Alicyclobacillus dauci]